MHKTKANTLYMVVHPDLFKRIPHTKKHRSRWPPKINSETRGAYIQFQCDVISLHVSMGYGVRGPGSFFVGPPVLEKWNRPASINQVLKHTVRGEGRILPKMDGPKKF